MKIALKLVAVACFVVAMSLGSATVGAQVSEDDVTEGEVEVVSVRETDPTLGPLVATLAGIGGVSLAATIAFWFFSRPAPVQLGTGADERNEYGDVNG